MLCRVELYDHVDEMLAEDPRIALFAIRRMLDEEIPWLEQRAVRMARADGKAWATIARALGRSRQAVQQRYGKLEQQWSPIPRRRPPLADQIDREGRRALADNAARRRQALSEAAGDDVIAW